METTRLKRLRTALQTYRERFRTATPLERSVLLMVMRALMEEVEQLASEAPLVRKLSPGGKQAA